MKKIRLRKKYWPQLGLVLLFLLVGISWYFVSTQKKKEELLKEAKTEEKPAETKIEKTEAPKVLPLPETALISVPYTVQAPYTNWNIHEESCEEAAVLMYHYFLTGSKIDVIPLAEADGAMRTMKNWQVANYGSEPDLSLTQLGEFAKSYWGYKYEVTKGVTAENIKKALAQGHPVLVPVMTHGLGNPHYGPNTTYHILVIKGYNATGVITNDAGIKEGRNYHYTWDILWRAIDQQTPKMSQGRDMLVITR